MTIAVETFPDPTRSRPNTRYVRPPQPIYFPDSEEMPETNVNFELRTALYSSLKREFAARHTIGSDPFVYYVPTDPKKNLAPDPFVKLNVPYAPFRTWKTWERGTPNLGVEIVSPSDQGDQKWDLLAAELAELKRTLAAANVATNVLDGRKKSKK